MLFVFVNEIKKKKPSSITPEIIMHSTDLQIKISYLLLETREAIWSCDVLQKIMNSEAVGCTY